MRTVFCLVCAALIVIASVVTTVVIKDCLCRPTCECEPCNCFGE